MKCVGRVTAQRIVMITICSRRIGWASAGGAARGQVWCARANPSLTEVLKLLGENPV